MKNYYLSKILFMLLMITVFFYSSLQAFLPIMSYDLNSGTLDTKINKLCSETFDIKNVDVEITKHIPITEKTISIIFKNRSIENVYGKVSFTKTIFNRYCLKELIYVDENGLEHSIQTDSVKDKITVSILVLLIGIALSIRLIFVVKLYKVTLRVGS